MFFPTRFLDLLFLIIFRTCFKNCRFWDPLQNPVGAKMATQIDQVPPKHPKSRSPGAPRTCSLFSGNHGNYYAVGTSWLLKGHLFDGDWLIFCFCCVSLYSVLCNMFITSFHKTSVNVKPLSPPIFEEIAAY